MLIVTGGAGLIGSNLIRKLNKRGRTDILVVDNLTNGRKFVNLSRNKIADYVDKHDFLNLIRSQKSFTDKIDGIFHQGACTDTTEWDGEYMLRNNYEYSKELFNFAAEKHIPFIYASSAAVYGLERFPHEDANVEAPLNVYGYSKFLFDEYVRRFLDGLKSQVVGLRYFNVYGFGEAHKGRMASMVYHFNNQIKTTGKLQLFGGSGGFADGEQRRDFIHVDDIVDAILWFFQEKTQSGIFNLGTGKSASFNELAKAIIAWHTQPGLKPGAIEYIPFPQDLQGSYQHFTEADITKLRGVGYTHAFANIEEGVKKYLDQLNAQNTTSKG